MRTFGLQHFSIALALAASLGGAPLAAQQSADTTPAAPALLIPARCTDAGCGGDFQLAIVATLYPYYDGTVRGPAVLTLVIENRGRMPAPLSTLEVAPVARFASYSVARRAPVAALMPGERTIVEIPLQLDAAGGAPCISISVSPSIVPTSAQAQRLASTLPAAGPSFAGPAFAPPPFVSFVGDDY